MIISHKYKFIFIKTYKTAGTSIEVFLSQFCDNKDVLTPILPPVPPHEARNYRGIWNPLGEFFQNKTNSTNQTLRELVGRKKFYNHIPAELVRHRIPKKIWNSYFKFCVERNPWDKTLSHYHMLNDRSGGRISIEQYFEEQKFCLNYPIYTNNRGHILVDKIVEYEFLIDELSEIFPNLGIPFEGSLGVRAKSNHRKDRRHYREVFTDEQRKAVEEAFSRELEVHKYIF